MIFLFPQVGYVSFLEGTAGEPLSIQNAWFPKSSEVRRSLWSRWHRIEQQMRPVLILILEPCGDWFWMILASVWSLSCHVMAAFFHGTRETKTTLAFLSLVKKVGTLMDTFIFISCDSFSNPTRLACWPHIAHTQATKNSLLRCAHCSMKFWHRSFNQLFLLKYTVPEFLPLPSSLHVCLSPLMPRPQEIRPY